MNTTINWEEILDSLKFNINVLIKDLIFIAVVLIICSIIMKIISAFTSRGISRASKMPDDPKALFYCHLSDH